MIRRTIGLALLAGSLFPCLSPAQSAPPAARRALTIEDYYRIQTVANPLVSPDGRWVVFTVSTRIEADNGTRTETYLVRSDASVPPVGQPASETRTKFVRVE